ncbi:unnamed protein product [Lymnaea stagnalis]|uniref:Uncharacterized protein n=1 Tax=Lymnaea stagnalis TaxID=6523 RepID=A0AAV2IKK3_LYMST
MEAANSAVVSRDRFRGNKMSETPKECARGCGLVVSANQDKEHSCIAALRSTIRGLKEEMTAMMEEQQREMLAQLDVQRGDMIQREAALHGLIDALKADMGRLSDRLKTLLEVESGRQRELDRMTSEREELMTMLKSIQKELEDSGRCQTCSCGKGKVTNV